MVGIETLDGFIQAGALVGVVLGEAMVLYAASEVLVDQVGHVVTDAIQRE